MRERKKERERKRESEREKERERKRERTLKVVEIRLLLSCRVESVGYMSLYKKVFFVIDRKE